MTASGINNWQDVQSEVRARIRDRIWKPGDLIPGEADLAREFGCARATVNRALRGLAETGVLERRRKAGTRVALRPVRRATLDIPIIRQEVEVRNQTYRYALLELETIAPPAAVAAALALPGDARAMKITALHLADGKPFVLEDRWVNLAAVPSIADANLSEISANEWLIMHAPFTHGNLALSALSASADVASKLNVAEGAALFVLERTTWADRQGVTRARLIYAPGYSLRSRI